MWICTQRVLEKEKLGDRETKLGWCSQYCDVTAGRRLALPRTSESRDYPTVKWGLYWPNEWAPRDYDENSPLFTPFPERWCARHWLSGHGTCTHGHMGIAWWFGLDQLQLVPSGGNTGPPKDQHGTQIFCLHPGPACPSEKLHGASFSYSNTANYAKPCILIRQCKELVNLCYDWQLAVCMDRQ
jgi:hypothetical protein